MSHSRWYPGQPQSNFDCAQYKRRAGGEAKWWSANCGDLGNFVCEISKFSINDPTARGGSREN